MVDKCPKCREGGIDCSGPHEAATAGYECGSYESGGMFFESMQCLRNQIDALQAIVDKLPRFADGAPVTKGAQMWMILDDRASVRCPDVRWSDLDDAEIDWSRQYSTREAAEAAQAKHEVTQNADH